MNLRALLLTLVLGAPAVALLLCGPRGPANAPSDRTVIRYWEKWSGVEGVAMQRIVDRYNATIGATDGIWVQYTPISSIEQRLLIAIAGGDPPDLAGIYDALLANYADRDALLPLDALTAEIGLDTDRFAPVWTNLCRYQGQLFALPSAPFTIALLYNRAHFRAAGLDPDRPPRTMAELDDYARRLTRWDADRTEITQLGFTQSTAMLGWWPWVWPCYFGAELWDGQRYKLLSKEARAAYAWIVRQRVELGWDAIRSFEATSGPIEGAQNAFLAGRLSMLFQGPWMVNWARTYAPQLDIGVAPFPSATADRAYAFASTDIFVIPRGAREPRAALRFLAYVLQPEVLEELCQAHGKLSPFRDAGPDFYDNHPNPFIRTFEHLAQSPDIFGFPQMPTWLAVNDELNSTLNAVMRGDHLERTLTRAQQKIDKIVQDYEQMATQRRGLRAPRTSPRRAPRLQEGATPQEHPH
ncbi:MAG: ABC transporter substrate-binding protein [Phycisphaerales bacterium]|nr:ABC transporter substrate-binding protein [Phycisphaerales bacterium]